MGIVKKLLNLRLVVDERLEIGVKSLELGFVFSSVGWDVLQMAIVGS
jgi:hypothetical protein